MIRNELVSVTIGGVATYPDSVSVITSVNTAYNSVVLNGITLNGDVGDAIRVVINSVIYDFKLTENTYQPQGKHTIKGLGIPYILSETPVDFSSELFLDSDTLISDNSYGVTIVNNIPNIVFNEVTYNSNGSALDAMLDMLKVIGGEYYEKNGVLYLDTFKTISETETPVAVIQSNEVFDHVFTDNVGKTEQVKNVLINPITDDIYSVPEANIDFDNEKNNGIILFNPSITSTSKYVIQGINTQPMEAIYYTESFSLTDETVLTTLGGIDSIVSLTINDRHIQQTEYENYPTHNKLRFLASQSGQCVIKYQTNVLSFSIGSSTDVLVKYKTAILKAKLDYYSKTTTDADTNITVPDDIVFDGGLGSVRIVPPFIYGREGVVMSSENINYDVIFLDSNYADTSDNLDLITSYTMPLNNETVNVYGKYKTGFFWDASFIYNAKTEQVSDVNVEEFKVLLTPNGAGTYTYELLEDATHFNGATADGVTIRRYVDYDVIGTLFKLLNNNLSDAVFKVSYNSLKNKLVFPLPTPDNNVSMIQVRAKDKSTSLKFLKPSANLCVVPSTITINIAQKLNISVAQAYGGHVNGDFGLLVVDYFGNVEVYVSNKRLYVLDTSEIVPFSSITIDARGVI